MVAARLRTDASPPRQARFGGSPARSRPDRYVLGYVLNAASQVTQRKVTLRGVSAKTWDYTYTDGGHLARVTNPDGEVTDPWAEES